jgi:hypothetical protein
MRLVGLGDACVGVQEGDLSGNQLGAAAVELINMPALEQQVGIDLGGSTERSRHPIYDRDTCHKQPVLVGNPEVNG